MELIQSALAAGRQALSEYQSKQVLQAYGVPVTRELPAADAAAAVAAAREIGYPVALKACDAALMHKSEQGAVFLNLQSDTAVTAAYDLIRGRLEIDPETMLVQEMVDGVRELVAGMMREPQFGPCVMVGLGGVMTEVLSDTAFRVAPFDTLEATDMIEELRCKKMLGAFRGQAPADLETLCRVLSAIGRIGLENDAVAEIDVNPLKIDPQGRVKAVDALIVLKNGHGAGKEQVR